MTNDNKKEAEAAPPSRKKREKEMYVCAFLSAQSIYDLKFVCVIVNMFVRPYVSLCVFFCLFQDLHCSSYSQLVFGPLQSFVLIPLAKISVWLGRERVSEFVLGLTLFFILRACIWTLAVICRSLTTLQKKREKEMYICMFSCQSSLYTI